MLRQTQEGWITQIIFESLKRCLTFVSPGESLFHHFKEGQTFVHRFRDEPIKCCDPPCELLDFFVGLGWRHVEDGLHLLRVHFYSSLRHHESQKLSWGYTKSTLTGVQLHLVLSKRGERLLQIIQMCQFFLTLDEHVIHIYFHVPPNLFAEHFIHQPLVGRPCIF